MKERIKGIISTLKSAYIERDVEKADELMALLFRNQKNPIIVGTSNGEWYFDEESMKELFVSDWKYWGNVQIYEDKYELNQVGNYYWVAFKASVEQVFEDTEERFERYYNTIKETSESAAPLYQKACYIQWMLAHLLHSRDQNKREYWWDLNLHIIFEIIDNEPLCKILQFSLPMDIDYTDVRIDYESFHKEAFRKECEAIEKYNKRQSGDPFDKKNQLLDEIKSWINEKYENLTDVRLLSEHMVVDNNGEAFCFCGSGIIEQGIDLENRLSETMKKIINRDYEGDVKDILFKIRRDITYHLKENAINQVSINPFRVIGVGKIREEEVTLERVDVSFPFSMILEQKTDFAQIK